MCIDPDDPKLRNFKIKNALNVKISLNQQPLCVILLLYVDKASLCLLFIARAYEWTHSAVLSLDDRNMQRSVLPFLC
jgi:hypothetical protein